MVLYIFVILYVISMLYILLMAIWYFLSLFICRKKTNCQDLHCPIRSYCSKSTFTEAEVNEIKNLLSTLEDTDLTDDTKKPEN